MSMRRVLIAGAAAAAMMFAGAAHAAQGLNGSYYAFNSGLGSLADAQAAIAASSGPSATFIANSVCFPDCQGNSVDDGSNLSDFLGGNASSLSNDISGLTYHAVVLNGFLNIGASGTYTFDLVSDDGSELLIDNGLVVNDDGVHPMQDASGWINLGAGLHSIQVVQFENDGGTGLDLFMNGDAVGGDLLQTPAGGVPEPASWALMIAGVAATGAMLRRRRSAVIAA